MIKNERQYRITRAKAREFAEALQALEEPAVPEGMHPRLKEAQEEALRSQYEELLDELSAYEALAERSILELPSFDRLPQALIQARIAENLTQKDLADRLGWKEQQIQRYEATEYASASWERIKAVLGALNAEVNGQLRLPRA